MSTQQTMPRAANIHAVSDETEYLPEDANIPQPQPENRTPTTSVETIGQRANGTVDLIEGEIFKYIGGLRQKLDEAEKLLRQQSERVRRVQNDLVVSAGALVSMVDSAAATLDALRAGQARLVRIEGGE